MWDSMTRMSGLDDTDGTSTDYTDYTDFSFDLGRLSGAFGWRAHKPL